jgi:carotenoid cleavage dioxygenase-like enzyme
MVKIPFSQRGPFTPMRFEASIEDCLVVKGEVPECLNGGFYRNGPTWRRPSIQGLETAYTIDGMMQGLIFKDGQVDFVNRWVRTPKFVAEQKAGRALFEWSDGDFGDWRGWGLGDIKRDKFTAGLSQGTSAISAASFGGEVLALGEQGTAPIRMDPITLETKGFVDWADKLSPGLHEPVCTGDAAFGPHPKWDPVTKELWAVNYRDKVPYMTIHCVSDVGDVRTRHIEDGPYSAVAHDMWLTESYAIVAFAPFLQDRKNIAKGGSVYSWDTSLPTKIAIVNRNDMDAKIIWAEADFEAEYIMHTLSANEIDGKIFLDGPIFDRPPFMTGDRYEPGGPYIPFWQVATSCIGRWIVDLKTGRVKSEKLGDQPVELPKVDERFIGQSYKWGFLTAGEVVKEGMRMNSVMRRNVITGEEDVYRIKNPSNRPIGVWESVFVPSSADAPEGNGFLITPVSFFTEGKSEFIIFDAENLSAGPIAQIELPFLIGWTPHGHWMDFND